MPFSWKDENTPPGYANETLPCRLCKKPVLPSTAGKTGGLCLECDHEERRRIEHEARVSHPGCPACDGSTRASAFSFDWEAARAGRGDMGKYPTYLRPQHRVKRGSRYRCSECGGQWYLSEAGRPLMIRVPPDSLAIFEEWCRGNIVCPPPALAAARRIGATGWDTRQFPDADVEIPCRITTRSGETFDPALLCFSWWPPVPREDDRPDKLPRYRLASDIATLAPSRLALSLGLRNRNLNLPSGGPVDRDWIATVTKARNGRVISLMPGTPFYDRDGVVGSELRSTWSTGGPMVRGQPYGAVTVFLADWCEEGRLCASGHPLTGLFAWLRGLGRSA